MRLARRSECEKRLGLEKEGEEEGEEGEEEGEKEGEEGKEREKRRRPSWLLLRPPRPQRSRRRPGKQ